MQLSSIRERVERLTARERQVIDLVISGLTNRAIADRFGVSSQAVDARRSNAMNKLQVDSIPALVKMMMILDESMEKVEAGAVSE